MAFVGGISKSLVMAYSFPSVMPQLRLIDVIDSPKSVFDIWGVMSQAEHATRNALKNILASGHKLVSHGGILTHVDRGLESIVSGPTIDTLVMGEILACELYGPVSLGLDGECDPPNTALEIGTGSGLLAASLVRYLPSLSKLVCVDIESQAIRCTEKNINVVLATPGSARTACTYVTGRFDPDFFNQAFDLIICNPPYIPSPTEIADIASVTPDRSGAVGGVTLIRLLLDNLKRYSLLGMR